MYSHFLCSGDVIAEDAKTSHIPEITAAARLVPEISIAQDEKEEVPKSTLSESKATEQDFNQAVSIGSNLPTSEIQADILETAENFRKNQDSRQSQHTAVRDSRSNLHPTEDTRSSRAKSKKAEQDFRAAVVEPQANQGTEKQSSMFSKLSKRSRKVSKYHMPPF